MTDAQRRAINRHNARHSTGPVTPEGKERARQNALKHGLCAEELVLPLEDADDLQDQFDEWVEHYQPVGPAEYAMVEEIAHAHLRLRRGRGREAAVVERQVVAAHQVWCHEQVGRLRAAHALFATDPAAAVEDLSQFGVGRRWMLERWDQLSMGLLRDRSGCAPALIEEGVRLLGGVPARPAAGPLLAYEFHLGCVGTRPVADPKAVAWLLSDAAIHPEFLAVHGREIPATAVCRDLVLKIVREEMEALQQEENDLQEDERREAAAACRRAQVPCDSPDTKLALRYESMSRAALHKALKTLDLLQDARFAAEAEAGDPPGPLPSVARNEPEPPPGPQLNPESVPSCDASEDTNLDDSRGTSGEGWLGQSRAAADAPAHSGASAAARPNPSRPDMPEVPVVTPERADSPPS